ncbi:MAG: glucose-6-phosphate isomerase family protein, partial [Patescibacteria group bacterium]
MSGTFSKNLKDRAGLDLGFKNSELRLGRGISGGEKSARRVEDLNPVLFQTYPGDERVVYHVWRNVRRDQDAQTLDRLNIRYDLTALYPGPIGRELPKTFGHYHAKNYPEVYEVLSGTAWWIIQKPKRNDQRTIEEA